MGLKYAVWGTQALQYTVWYGMSIRQLKEERLNVRLKSEDEVCEC